MRFRVTLFTARSSRQAGTARDPVDQAILNALESGGKSTAAIASAISLTTRATRTRLIRLVAYGLVVELGSSPQDPKRLYHLPGSTDPGLGEGGRSGTYGFPPDDGSSSRDSHVHEHEEGFAVSRPKKPRT